jgi:hypothetical protein
VLEVCPQTTGATAANAILNRSFFIFFVPSFVNY